ncbi:MAG: hypothetical protein HOC24_15365, partial [Deltaproteobacteria bacterium]|nr:hypothetical protein [Deltaproteobacteria bacterium]
VNLARASGLSTDAHRILDTSPDERFGSTVLVFDRNGDSTADLFIGAPYAAGTVSGNCTGINCGKVYYKGGRDYAFASATDTTSDTSTLTDTLSGSSDKGLFGSSMVIGATDIYFNDGTTEHLYVGAPGQEQENIKGYVDYYGVVSGTNLVDQDQTVAGTLTENSTFEIANNLFGYSLSVVSSDLDTEGKCPCLLIGAPGSGYNIGKVRIFGEGLETYIAGSNSTDFLGTSLYTDYINISDLAETVFIGSKNIGSRNDNLGKITVLRSQNIVSGATSENLIATTTTTDPALAYSPVGVVTGENLARSISIVQYDSSGNKALILGAPGEHDTSSSYLYNRPGIVDEQKGSVQIISATKLGF